MPNEWREVLDRLDVEAFYRSEGIEIRGGKALCPWHEDKHPSMSIEPTKGLFKCHACGAEGSVFDFYSRKHGVTFAASVSAVAAFTGTVPTPKIVEMRRPPENMESQARAWWVNLRRTPAALAYLREKRGLTDETIERELLGWTGKRYSIPIRVDGKVVNAKLYDPHASGGDKMIWHVAGTKAPLYVPLANVDPGMSLTALLVEGELDALVGTQLGWITYSGTAGARTWKDEWNEGITQENVVTLYDADESGVEGAQMAARSLTRSGKVVGIARWPQPVASGYDLTDLIVVDRGSVPVVGGGLRSLIARAAPYVPVAAPLPEPTPEPTPEPAEPIKAVPSTARLTFEQAVELVNGMPEGLSPHALMIEMRKHLPRLSALSKSELRMLYEGPLADRYKKTVKRQHIRTMWEDVTPLLKSKAALGEEPQQEELISDFKHMDLGQAWMEDTLYYTVTRGTIETVTLPDHVTTVRQPKFEAVFVSKHGMMKADTTALAQQKFYLNGVRPHVNFNESWESDPKIKYSWGWYLDHTTDLLDIPPLYEDVRDVFSRYLYVQDDAFFDTLACYTMLSYVYRVFRSVGYIWFRALRGSGKTRALDIFQCVGFNSLKLIDPSESFMYRKIAATSPLVLIDEAEQMGDDDRRQMRTILNMGYLAGTGIGRSKVDGESKEITEVEFDVFGPKVLASIGDPDPTVADRCIVYDMERSPRNLPDFNSDRTYPKWVSLRNRLHCYGMQYAHRIAALAGALSLDEDGKPRTTRGEEVSEGLRNRDRQVWTPILAVALFVDEEAGNIATAPIFTKVLEYAKRYVIAKQSAVGEESEFQVVMGIRSYIREHPAVDHWYDSGALLEYVRQIEGVYEKYSGKRLNSLIFNKLKIGNRDNDRKRKTGTRSMFYRIDSDLLEQKCRSFGLTDEDMISLREPKEHAGKPTREEEPESEMEKAAKAMWDIPP